MMWSSILVSFNDVHAIQLIASYICINDNEDKLSTTPMKLNMSQFRSFGFLNCVV